MADLFLSPGGDLQKTVSTLKAGDVLNLRAGQHPKGFLSGWDAGGEWGPIVGTAEAPIVVQAYPTGALVTITGPSDYQPNTPGLDGIGFEVGGGGCAFVKVVGITIQGDKINRAGIRVEQSTGIQIIGCKVFRAGQFGIHTSHTTDCVLDGNEVGSTRGSGLSGKGIYVANSAVRPVVTNNNIHDCGSDGCQLNADRTQGGTGIIDNATVQGNTIARNAVNAMNGDGLRNSNISKNLMYGNGNVGIALYQIDGKVPSTGNVIALNTIYQPASGGAAIKLMNGAKSSTVQNNILAGGNYGTFNFSEDSLSNLKSDYNAIVTPKFVHEDTGKEDALATWQAAGHDKHSIVSTGAALFADVNKPDTLKPGSPALGAGTPAGTNIGYSGGTSLPPPPPPPFVLGKWTFSNGEPTLAEYRELCRKASYGDISGPNGLPDGMVDSFDLNAIAVSSWQKPVPPAL